MNKKHLIIFGILLSIVLVMAISYTTTRNETLAIFGNGSSRTLSNIHNVDTLNASYINRSWIDFDGTNDNLTLPNNLSFAGNYTICLWFNNSNSTTNGYLFHSDVNNKTGLYYSSNSTDLKFEFSETGFLAGNYTFNTNTWNHACMTSNWTTADEYNGTGYFNGAIVNAMTFNASVTINDTTTTIGSYNGIFYSGSIDEVRIWNETLALGDITAIYNEGRYPNASINNSAWSASRVLWYSLNEGSGTTAHDLTGYNQNGIVSGASWKNDSEVVNMVNGTDYSVNGNQFKLMNIEFAWSPINVSYKYDYTSTTAGGGSVSAPSIEQPEPEIIIAEDLPYPRLEGQPCSIFFGDCAKSLRCHFTKGICVDKKEPLFEVLKSEEAKTQATIETRGVFQRLINWWKRLFSKIFGGG